MDFTSRRQACHSCICAGYVRCTSTKAFQPPFEVQPWWQENEDGLKIDQRGEAEYLELLELNMNSSHEAQRARKNRSWKEWEDYMEIMARDWEAIQIYPGAACGRHDFRMRLVRVHNHML